MKILLVTTLYPGYLEQHKIQATYAVHYFAKEWAKKHKVQVIRLWPYYPNIFNGFKKARMLKKYAYEEKFTLDGVNILRVPILKIPRFNYREKEISLVSKQIIKSIKKESKIDLTICDTLNPSIYLGKKISEKFNSTLIASLHNTDISYLSRNKNYTKYIKIDTNVDKIVFRSKKIEKNFLKLYNGEKDEKDFFTITFGIDKKNIINNNKLEQRIINSNKIIIVATSLKKLKKVNILIEAFAKIENRNGYVLIIIGDGPERVALKKQVKNLGLDDYIYFEGIKTREEVLSFMEKSDIFAMVSSPETFGLVYVEAMAKGCITIGSKGEGIDGVIINNENGFLCIPDNVEDLKETLERAIALNIKEKKQIINNAINTASKLNHEDLSKKFLENINNSTFSHKK